MTAKAYSVLDHIDATIPKPTYSDALLWVQLNAVVVQWIYTTICVDLLVTILDEKATAMGAWTTLAELFQLPRHLCPLP